MQISMMWGLFPFSVQTMPHEEFEKTTTFKYAENNRIGKSNSLQFMGKGNDEITLKGVLFPMVTGGRNVVDLFKIQSELGIAFPLIESSGRIHGTFVCTSVAETCKYLESNNAPNRIDFTISFKRSGDDILDYASIITTQLVSLI